MTTISAKRADLRWWPIGWFMLALATKGLVEAPGPYTFSL